MTDNIEKRLAEIEKNKLDWDCGDSSCRFAIEKTGMRTNGGCRCIKSEDFQLRQYVYKAVKDIPFLLKELRKAHEELKKAQEELKKAQEEQASFYMRKFDDLWSKAKWAEEHALPALQEINSGIGDSLVGASGTQSSTRTALMRRAERAIAAWPGEKKEDKS